ncbi:isoprenylcysteine carboxylmethyltransferase family protein [Marivibrio halodurans]|nr:isoprenylcysteine carboxylmethyltransferase family protein [Marivibrio halodurans]
MEPDGQTLEAAGLAREAGPMIGAGAIALGIVIAILFQRIGEWMVARRNEAALRAHGFHEAGPRFLHSAGILLQGAWLIACGWVALTPETIHWPAIVLYAGLQVARLWVILSLGPFWTGRILTHDEAPVLRRGPYRHLRHPLHWIVAVEVALLPLAFGAWPVALAFTPPMVALLILRARAEDAALAGRPAIR